MWLPLGPEVAYAGDEQRSSRWPPFRLVSLAVLGLFSSLSRCADPDTLGLTHGFITFETSSFVGKLVNDTQILVSLALKKEPTFDFVPFDKMSQRADNGNNHLGDINFRYRVEETTPGSRKLVDAASERDSPSGRRRRNSNI